MENSWALLALLVTLSVIINKIIKRQSPKLKHPPGPKPWPVIGNLNLLGSIPHQSLHELSKKYGDIMLLKFGKYPVVVASSPEMAKQFLRVHDIVFASRPPLAAGKYTGYNYSDMAWAPYGPYWKQARKIYLSEVFSTKRLEFFEQIRAEERKYFLSHLLSQSGKPVMLRDHLSCLTLSTISRMVLGNKYFCDKDHSSIFTIGELRAMLDEWFVLNGVFNVGDWIPWLSFLDLQGYVGRMKDLYVKFDRFFDYVIDDHLARRAAQKESFSPKDMVDVLLQQAEDPNLETKLTRDCVKGLLQDLLAGGTDTAAAAVEWAIHEMLRQPQIMEKAKEELNRVIGRRRWVNENDLHQLPYMDAIVMETWRLHPVATLLAPHYAIEDCKVVGYDISKGTTVLVNTWSMGRDPGSWHAPEDFLPERFLGKEIDVTGNNFALLPFGSGRRGCPGHNLGLKMVRTMLANLVHGFELKLVEGMRPEDICMEEVYGLTTHPKYPISIIMNPNLDAHLY